MFCAAFVVRTVVGGWKLAEDAAGSTGPSGATSRATLRESDAIACANQSEGKALRGLTLELNGQRWETYASARHGPSWRVRKLLVRGIRSSALSIFGERSSALNVFSKRSSAWNILSERPPALNIPGERSSALNILCERSLALNMPSERSSALICVELHGAVPGAWCCAHGAVS